MTILTTADWSPEQREEHLQAVMNSGWSRIHPPLLPFLLVVVGLEGSPFTREGLFPFLRRGSDPQDALDASCWDDEDENDDPQEAAALATARAATDGYAAHFGLPPLRTVNDLIDLLVAAGAVQELPDEGGVPHLHPAQPFPVPQDVLPLAEEEAAIQRKLRIEAAYEGDSYRIIDLFDSRGARHSEIRTSLGRLARIIDGNAYDARQALQILLDAGDFTASVDLEGLAEHKVFRVRCDWEEFDSGRIHIHGVNDQGQLVIDMPKDLELDRGR
ncbi:DUF6042 family protein [Streptomyces polyrhachis]|uniref:DUF6042 family protein n=1 Tax=Streptomyces polyrhachis TaxID=1282885 RepID=A0ABW2GJC5_9ACTN